MLLEKFQLLAIVGKTISSRHSAQQIRYLKDRVTSFDATSQKRKSRYNVGYFSVASYIKYDGNSYCCRGDV